MAEDGEAAAGYWGEYLCDMPEHTVEHMLNYIATEHTVIKRTTYKARINVHFTTVMCLQDIEIILMTGDFPAHDLWYQGTDENVDSAYTVINMVREYFPNATVLPSMGNHEAFPANM